SRGLSRAKANAAADGRAPNDVRACCSSLHVLADLGDPENHRGGGRAWRHRWDRGPFRGADCRQECSTPCRTRPDCCAVNSDSPPLSPGGELKCAHLPTAQGSRSGPNSGRRRLADALTRWARSCRTETLTIGASESKRVVAKFAATDSRNITLR